MTTTNQSLINAFFSQICINRRNQQLKNIPPLRYDSLSISPYLPENGGFTQKQLDMRRKAEILTYNSNRILKINSLTKAQKFSLIAKNNTTTIPVYNSQCFTNEYGQYILTPSSSCDVPGPIIMLYNDKQIPLYNFTNGNNVNAITTHKDTNYFFQ